MVDSFGRTVAEADFANGSLTAAGVDGTAADEVPITDALVRVIDNAGHSVVGKTDALGYYRVRVDGFVPPLVASVTRADGQVHFAASIAAIKVRGFVTMNITSLTDKLASDAAEASGFGSAALLSPKTLAGNPPLLESVRVAFNAQWASLIKEAGLDATTFDAVTKAFRIDGTGYAKLLGNFVWTLTSGGTTVLTPRLSVGGSIVGLGNRPGLSLANGSETLSVAADATTFTFSTRLARNAAYNVSLVSQPAGLSCGIANGSGVMNLAAVTDVLVLCSQLTNTVGGSIKGLGSSSDLVLGSAGLTLAIPANAPGFVFPISVPLGGSYAVYVVSQPVGKTCGVANGSGIQQGNGPITTPVVTCTLNTYLLGGTVSGLTQAGLILTLGDQTVAVPAANTAFVFPNRIPYGSSYKVSIYAQPAGQTCTIANGAGTVGAADINSVAVTCTTNTYVLGGFVNGLTSSNLVIGSNGQILVVPFGSTTFTFPYTLPYGTVYNVVVLIQPDGQACTVTNASGTITANTVGTININCANVAAKGG